MVKLIKIKTKVEAPVKKVWDAWTDESAIIEWNHASDDWYCPRAKNRVKVGGKFNICMSSKDGKEKFDFKGEYIKVVDNELIEYVLDDGRKVKVEFQDKGNKTIINETFEPENENPPNMQKYGWQAILDNFKKYVEGN